MPRAAWVTVAALVVTGACARVMPPSGWPSGKPDVTPPQLVSTDPAELAVVPNFKGDVVFEFGERVSEQGISDQIAVVSPDTGLPRVSKRGSEVRVRPREGWRPGLVYQVVLLPGVKDMFGNARKQPAQVVFSTGPAIEPTVIAGLLVDRITGQPASDALVQAVHDAADSLTYTTASDSSGFFALRYLPRGAYLVRAFEDKNHDRHAGFREPQAQDRVDLAATRDSAIIPQPLALLPLDTTPARLTRADYVDSLRIKATLDDYLDPARGLGGVTVSLYQLPDSTPVPVTGLYFPAQYDSLKQAADTSAGARRARAVGGPDTAAARKRKLPTQELVILPGRPLSLHSRYRLTVSGIVNINNVPGGGGSQTFTTPEPPPQAPTPPKPAPAGADTTRARPGGAAQPPATPANAGRPAPGRPPATPADTARPGRGAQPPAVPADTGTRTSARDTTTRR